MYKKLAIFFVLCSLIFPKDSFEKYGMKDFKFDKMLGTWYEIARKDSVYENHLDFAKTTYTLLPTGEFDVVTKGFNTEKNKNTITTGKGRLKYEEVQNIFEVKFFKLFYSEYVVLDYDRKNYSYILIKGSSEDYLWILSREPHLSDDVVKKLLKVAEKDGINTGNLTYVKQK